MDRQDLDQQRENNIIIKRFDNNSDKQRFSVCSVVYVLVLFRQFAHFSNDIRGWDFRIRYAIWPTVPSSAGEIGMLLKYWFTQNQK